MLLIDCIDVNVSYYDHMVASRCKEQASEILQAAKRSLVAARLPPPRTGQIHTYVYIYIYI